MLLADSFHRGMSPPNEVFGPDGEPYAHYRAVLGEMARMGVGQWERRTRDARAWLVERQRELGMEPEEGVHPTDFVPRIVPATDWELLERGLAQRMRAINEWLKRLEAGRDEVVPEEVIRSSALFDPSVPTRFGSVPNRQMGFDVVAEARSGGAGGWEYLIIEDNAKMPVGIEPMSLLRTMTPGVLPESYGALGVRSLDGLMDLFGEVVRAASPEPDPTVAILSTGPDDQYYIDHRIFAAELGAILAERDEVEMDAHGRLVHKGTGRKIDVVYERIETGRIFDYVPGLAESHYKGLVNAVFAPNLDVADDTGVYPFVPDMIRTYLGEEPVLANVDTYSLAVEEDRRYVMDHFEELVIKSRSGWGGKDVLIAPQESKEDIEGFRKMVEENPIEYVAQKTIDFSTHVLCETEDEAFVLRDAHADLRIHALAPDADEIQIVPGAMTRVAVPGSKLVNISSGGGKMKDTWVLSR